MLDNIIKFSIKNKLIVILFVLTLSGFGIYTILNIPVGAVPDITNNQVQVITTSTNLSTSDIEQFITYPVELEMANLPGVKEIRSISKFGLSVVTIVFDDKLGTYLPRQLIAEKIKTAVENIPQGFGNPTPGPITTGLGEIYQYILDTKPGYEDKYSPTELRTIQDWIVKRQLSGIPGVVEINTWGGFLKQYEVAINPQVLNSLDITIQQVYDALSNNNSIAGGAYIEKENKSYFIRGEGLIKSIEDIKSIVVKNTNGIPVLIKDIAEVRYGHANRFGAITANGEGEKVLGQIMMLKDADSKVVINEVKKRVEELQKTLPEGVFINPILERGELIDKTTFTVTENLLIGFLIVLLVVILLLGNVRSGLVIASLIPLSLFFTISLMYIFGIDANLMSLGAIDFGIIIDGAVIIVEFIVIRLSAGKLELQKLSGDERQTAIDNLTFGGASKMMNSAIFGQFIILIVFIPILSLTGVEGKMFRPMALAFSFALIGAIILCFTWLPVAASLFLKPENDSKRNISKRIMSLLYKSYDPVIKWSYTHKKIVLGLAVLSLVITFYQFTRMGGEFVPTLDEGDFVIQPVLKTGTSLSKTVETTTQMEQILIADFPNEVDQIVSRIGAAEVPTDPMSMEEVDVIIKLKPKKEWVTTKSKEELADQFKEALSVIPGLDYEFTQPIEMRFNELITGVRADVAVKVFGEDLEVLNIKANEIKELIEGVEGAADVIVEKTAGLPQMSVNYKRDKIAEYGLNIGDINRMISLAFAGETAGNVFEGQKRFDLVLRLQEDFRKDIRNVEDLYVDLPNGNQIKLNELADIYYTTGPAKISRDNTRRRVVVSINVRNRDLESVVMDVQKILGEKLILPPGYNLEYGGQFENLKNASNRLMFAVPVALLLILIMLHFAFKSLKEALLVFSAIPLATVGGVFLLSARGMPFSISAGVGFIALFGIAVLNGIVLIEYLKELKEKGITDMRERIFKATKERLRPVILTASAAALGFLPMAISTSAGAEVQRPLATVVIGGLVTSTLLTMVALPLLYAIFDPIKGFRLKPFGFIRHATLIILFLGVGYSSKAQDNSNELTLEDAVRLALENNREFKAADLKVKQQHVLVAGAFNMDKTNIYYGSDQNNVAENGYPLNIIGLEQTINFPSVYINQRNAALLNVNIAETEKEIIGVELEKKVSKAYYEILYLLNRVKELEYLSTLYTDYSKAAELKYTQGESNYLAYLNALAKQKSMTLKTNQSRDKLNAAYSNMYALIQSDSIGSVEFREMNMLLPDSLNMQNNPQFRLYDLLLEYEKLNSKKEKQLVLPDFTVNVFSGTNAYPNANNYFGYQIGLSIPIVFGPHVSKVKSAKISVDIATELTEDLRIKTIQKAEALKLEAAFYKKALDDYFESGKKLADEIINTAVKSYNAGETDFFTYSQSLENASELKLNFLENLAKYNEIVLEFNYITQ
jgi:cobalt-zinc-cadmium resistance protein CzcA